jgi:hypothetical protein
MHYGEPNLNEGKDWSELDLFRPHSDWRTELWKRLPN